MYSKKEGFTLIEIMIVIMIVGLLATLSYPSYKQSRENAQRTVCINNLRVMQHAADRYLFERPDLTEISPDDLVDYFSNNRRPDCPAGGSYTITVVDGYAQSLCDFGFEHELK